MRTNSKDLVCLLVALLVPATCPSAQDSPPRDPRAVAVLQQSLTAMGSGIPADSSARGRIEITEGSSTESGTIVVLTRGLDQTAERMQTDQGTRSSVYGRLRASLDATRFSSDETEIAADGLPKGRVSVERAISTKSACFPIIPLAAALTQPDYAVDYVGLESLDSAQVHHIRIWNTFKSQPQLQPLAEFTAQDLWIDAQTGLPRKLSYELREAGGAPAIPVELSYGDYRNAGGFLYPHEIKKALNGTHWGSISIEQVSFNVGLNESEFAVDRGAR